MKDQNTPNNQEETKESFDWKAELLSWIQIIVAAAAIAFVLNTFIIANSRVPSASMENTIMTGDRVIGSRLTYYFNEPERGDIAIFIYGYGCRRCHVSYQENPDASCPSCGQSDKKNEKIYYVKRVIGLPGDTIDIRDNGVYLNGSQTPLEEPYLPEIMETPEELHFEVPEDHYFMLGDNRNFSADARFWYFNYIDSDRILAKVLFRYFPKISKIQ